MVQTNGKESRACKQNYMNLQSVKFAENGMIKMTNIHDKTYKFNVFHLV